MNKLTFSIVVSAALNISYGPGTSAAASTAAMGNSRFPVGSAPGVVEIADVNGDGKPDIIVANERSNDVTILLGDGKGGFTQAKGSPFPAGHAPNDIAVGDFNRDGRLDLAFANHENKYLTVLLGEGQGGFTPAPNSPFAADVKPHTHGVAFHTRCAGPLRSVGCEHE